MTTGIFLDVAVKPALSLLPPRMDSADARAMILAICLQESKLTYRRQIRGPARSYAQFEGGKMSGIANVLSHPKSAKLARSFCLDLDIAPDLAGVYEAIEWNDVLCAGFTRLNLWTSPSPMPGIDEPDRAWHVYESVWHPGKPHPATWNGYYAQAWAAVVPDLHGSTRA